MKFTAIFILIASLTVSARSFSQNVTLAEKNSKLEKVFKSIKEQTGYVFFYDQSVLSQAKPVTVNIQDAPLETALNICFRDQPLSYSIVGTTIVVKPKQTSSTGQSPLTPPIDVKGRIVNENGEPVLATIQIKGANKGTTTNSDGYFEIKSVEEDATLVISGVNIQSFEVQINGRSELVLNAKVKVESLNEVVINKGYYSTSKRLNTGNVSKVSGLDIQKQPVYSPLQALEGRVPGLVINQNTGVPGSSFTVRVRGQNSLRPEANDPLYIVDGVPYPSSSLGNINLGVSIVTSLGSNPLNYISPSSIESIEILKDADATAIYGSRGANGVILITTKKGKAGETKVDFTFYAGVGKVTRKMDLLNTREYLDLRYEAFKNDNINISPTTANAFDLTKWDTTRYTDWQRELIGGTAHLTDAQLVVSGGNASTQFIYGAGYHKETTVFPGDFDYKKASAQFGASHSSNNKRFNASFSIIYTNDQNNLPTNDLTQRALTLPPDAPPVYDSLGKLNWANSTWVNPLSYVFTKYKAASNNLVGNSNISFKLFPGCVLKTSGGYTNINFKELNAVPQSSQNPSTAPVAVSQFVDQQVKTWIIEPQLEYSRSVKKSKLTALIGSTFQETTQEGERKTGRGFASDDLIENIAAASVISFNSYNYSDYKYNSLFARLNYDYNRKYLVNITARRDGSSRFGPGKQFANFGAIGLGWIFSQEKFVMEKLAFLSYGKLRGSYGVTGSDQLPDYLYLSTYTPIANYYQGMGLSPTALLNPDFRWEENRKFEGSLELGFLNDDLLFNFSFYRNRSSNQLVGYPLAPTTGFTSIQYNLPATVQNAGLEFEINAHILERGALNWNTSLNLTIARNKLISYPNLAGSSYASTYIIGEPLSILRAYYYSDINPQTGLYTVKDLNGDGVISTANDKKAFRNTGEKYYGGVQNTVSYKNFNLDFLFQFVNQLGRSYTLFFAQLPGYSINQPNFVVNHWQKSGDNSNIQKISQDLAGLPGQSYRNFAASDASFIDASFIRLKNVSLSYTIPKSWLQKLHLQNSKLFIQGQNLLTITKYKGLDPENNGFISLPPLKVITAGIQLVF